MVTRRRLKELRETVASGDTHLHKKTKFACIVKLTSTRKRLELESTLPRNHDDHIAEKAFNSLTCYNLVHKFIPMPQAMKIPDAKAAVDKDRETLEKILAWQLTKVRNKSEVIAEARNEGRTVFLSDGQGEEQEECYS